AKRSGVPPETIAAEMPNLAKDVRELDGGLLVHRRGLGSFVGAVREHLDAFYRQSPLRMGLPKEEVRRKLGIGGKEFTALLSAAESAGDLQAARERVALPGRTIALNAGQARIAEGVVAAATEAGYNMPTVGELKERFKGRDTDEIIVYLTEQGQVVRVGDDMIISSAMLEEAARRTREHLKANGKIAVSAFREMLGTSRKYAMPLMEWMDEQKITRRAGDERLPGPNA
ncbi:MAG TPA: SelB C-terminal domain-containing protein, partial [Symbiobacteriaceae bacterium]|nr:SelB C-terminal domain-containing protein [Symbiobacteriaceae bacterium]